MKQEIRGADTAVVLLSALVIGSMIFQLVGWALCIVGGIIAVALWIISAFAMMTVPVICGLWLADVLRARRGLSPLTPHYMAAVGTTVRGVLHASSMPQETALPPRERHMSWIEGEFMEVSTPDVSHDAPAPAHEFAPLVPLARRQGQKLLRVVMEARQQHKQDQAGQN